MKGRPQSLSVLIDAAGWRHLAATRVSEPIRECSSGVACRGTVVGVHRSAVNVLVDGQLITVAHQHLGGLPMGISVSDVPALDQLGIRPGMPAAIASDAVRFSDARVQVGLAAASTWSPRLPSYPEVAPKRRTNRLTRSLHLAAPMVSTSGFGPLLRAMGGDSARQVDLLGTSAAAVLASALQALADGEIGKAAHTAGSLIGRGPGATPSGDDLLVGLLAGLAATRQPGSVAFARLVAAQAPNRTTRPGEAFLRHAGRLEFSERVSGMVTALLRHPSDDLALAIVETCSWGASSGVDLLTGLLIGVGADLPIVREALDRIADGAAVAA